MNNTFISYRRDTGYPYAKIIYDSLKERKISVFMDFETLHEGRYPERIREEIQNCQNFILILCKGSLAGCTNEKDWIRREVTEAVKAGRNIIPILCNGFTWPEEWDSRMPKEICDLQDCNGVGFCPEYLDAMLDKIIRFLKGVPKVKAFRECKKIEEYMNDAMRHPEEVLGFDMALQGGSYWHTDVRQRDMLQTMLNAGTKIRLILNTPDTAELIARHMRHGKTSYVSFDECIKKWRELEQEYPEQLEVHVTDVPLLRRYYSFHFRDESKDSINISYYTYKNPNSFKNLQLVFGVGAECFGIYREEYEYLWGLENLFSR